MANFPAPGQPVRGSTTGKPIMALFDLLGRRWAMGVLWQLSQGPCTFRELQGRCESISPTVLNARIKELRQARLIERANAGYQLTDSGEALHRILQPFGPFSRQWAATLAEDDTPPASAAATTSFKE